MTEQFSFHDQVGLRLATQDAGALEFYRAELGAHASQIGQGLPQVNLRWKHASFPKSPGPDYQLEVHKRLAHWYYRIELGDGRVHIDCVGNRLALPMAWHMLVHPSLSYLAATAGWMMLHAAAVVWEGQSVILTGLGGVGKTTTSSLLLRSGPGWKLHADDYVFLGPGGRSGAFATRSHAYLDLLRWLPDLRQKLRPAELMRLLFFGSLRTVSGNRIRWPLRLDARRLWPDRELAMTARPGAILLVGDRTRGGVRLRRLGADEEPSATLLAINFSERRHFSRLLKQHLGAGEAERILEAWRHRERRLLEQIVTETAVYELNIPRRATPDAGVIQELSSKLQHMLRAQSAGERAN